MLSEEEYYEFYRNNKKCIDQMQIPNNPLSSRTLLTKYKNYIRKETRKEEKSCNKKKPEVDFTKYRKGTSTDERWIKVKKAIWLRDRGECQLIKKLPKEELKILKENSGGLHKTIDPAHTIWTRRSNNPQWYYLIEGIVLLNRASHSWLDTNKHPLTGIMISKEEAQNWWEFILGEEQLEKLIGIIEGIKN